MKKLTFKERLGNKINESVEARKNLYKDKEQNRIKLKKKIIERLEERILSSVPQYATSKTMNLSGSIFLVYEQDNEYYIDVSLGDSMVLFESVDEIRSFIEEIVTEFGVELKFDMKVYEDSALHKATIRFEYEYTEN